MKLLSYVLAGSASAVCMTLALVSLTKLGFEDVAEHFDLGRALAPPGVVAGDVYAVHPDGLRNPVKICAMALDAHQLETRDVDLVFSNVFAVKLPAVVALLDKVGLVPGEFSSSTGAYNFAAEYTNVPLSALVEPGVGCEDRVLVDYAAARFKLCIVQQALNPKEQMPLSAFTFAAVPVVLPDELFVQYGRTNPKAATSPRDHFPAGSVANLEVSDTTEECPSSLKAAWDVRMRDTLRIISVKPNSTAVASSL